MPIIRYIDWIATTPLMLFELCMIGGAKILGIRRWRAKTADEMACIFNLGTTCLDFFVFFHLKCFFQHLFLYIIQIRPRKHTTIFIIGCDLMMLVGGIVSAMFVPKAKVMLKYVSRVSESHFILFFFVHKKCRRGTGRFPFTVYEGSVVVLPDMSRMASS